MLMSFTLDGRCSGDGFLKGNYRKCGWEKSNPMKVIVDCTGNSDVLFVPVNHFYFDELQPDASLPG